MTKKIWFPAGKLSDKRICIELFPGKRVYIIGGNDYRPIPPGIAAFTHKELEILFSEGNLKDTMPVCVRFKEQIGGEITAVERKDTGVDIDYKESRAL